MPRRGAGSRRPGRRSRLPLALVPSLLLTITACQAPAAPELQGAATARSTPIALSPDGRSLWIVNPDAGSVTRLDTATLVADEPIAVGAEPWSVAVAPNGTAVVANRADGTLTVIAAGGTQPAAITHLPVGAEPSAVALSPTGDRAFVMLASEAKLVEVDLRSRAISNELRLAASPSALVVVPTADGLDVDSLVVTHLLAQPLPGGGPGRTTGC